MSLDKVISAGTTFASVGKVIFSNSNGVSFGADGQTITASVNTNYQSTGNYLTTARASNDAIGLNTAITQNGVSMTANSSGLSLNFPAFLTTAQPPGAYLTTARASNDGVGLNTAQTNVTWTVNSSGISLNAGGYAGTNTATTGGISVTLNTSGISLNAPAFLTTADLSANSSKYVQNWKLTGNIAGTTSSAQGTDLWLAGGNGVTISGSSNTLSFSVATNYQSQGAYLTTARASTDAVGLNIAQTNVTWTVNSSGISLNAVGYAGTGTTFAGANISGSITNNSVGLNLSLSVAAPGAANENNWINLLGAQTAGNTTASGSTIGWSGSEVTLSGTNNSVVNVIGNTFSNSNNITFGKNAGTITASYQEDFKSYFFHGAYVNTSAFTMGGSTNYVQPFLLPFNISASYIRIANSFQFGSQTSGTSANVSLTLQNSRSIWVNIYTKGVGANSKTLQFLTSGSVSMVLQVRVEIGAASNNQTVSHNFTYPSSEGAAQGNFATNYNVNSGSWNVSTTHLTSFNGSRWLDVPFAATLSRGNYWMAIAESTATATTGGIGAITNCTVRNSYVAVTQISANIAVMGGASNISTAPWLNGLGYWSTNTNGSSSSSLGLASISTFANQAILPFQIIREA